MGGGLVEQDKIPTKLPTTVNWHWVECKDLSEQETQSPSPPHSCHLSKRRKRTPENKVYKALEGELPLIFVVKQELMSAMKGSTHFQEEGRLLLTLA